MTVSTSTNRWEYDGNGATTAFPYTGKIFAATDLVVHLIGADGNATLQTLNTDYTVSGVGAANGGNVTFTTAPANGVTVLIRRVLPLTQSTSVKNQGAFYPEIHEDAFDRLVMLDQQQQDQIDRSLRRPDTSGDDYDAEGCKIINLADPENDGDAATRGYVDDLVGTIVATGGSTAPTKYEFVGDGVTTDFACPGINVSSPDAYIVTIDGVLQNPGDDYGVDLTSDEIEFSAAPPDGSLVVVRTFGFARIVDDAATLRADLASSTSGKGSELVTFSPAGAGAVARTVQAKLREIVSVKDFGAVGNGTADDTDAVTAFFSHLATNGGIGIVPPGTYRTTSGISITPSKPFRVIGSGKASSVFKLAASSDTTLLAVIGPTDSVVSDIGLDCGYSETGFASHGISVSNPRGMIFERCHVADYKNSAGLMFASTLDTYGQSHFIDCTADGNGAANNGFLLADLLDSTIDNCDVENLAAAGSPGYGLQLKNKCVRSKIIGGSARGCRGGYVLASDGAEGPIGCQIIGGNASGSHEGLVVGKSTACSVMGLDIDMANNAAAGYAANIGAGNSGNVIDVTVRNVAATKTAIRVGSDDQTVILRHGSGVGAKLLELTAGVDRCRTIVMDLTDTFTSILDLVQDDSGTATNEILLMSNLLSGGLSGNSYLRAPTPGKPNNWIAFVGSQDGVNVRTNGVDRVTIRPTYHAPGADNTMSSARAGARWSEVFAATGTINTSDAREKTDIGAIPDEWLDAWADVQYSRFKFIDAVTKKGDGARWHVGVVAQQVRDAFAAHGLDALEIGLLCYDEWGDEYDTEGNLVIAAGNRWGIRADECQFMEIALMRRELSRLKTIG